MRGRKWEVYAFRTIGSKDKESMRCGANMHNYVIEKINM